MLIGAAVQEIRHASRWHGPRPSSLRRHPSCCRLPREFVGAARKETTTSLTSLRATSDGEIASAERLVCSKLTRLLSCGRVGADCNVDMGLAPGIGAPAGVEPGSGDLVGCRDAGLSLSPSRQVGDPVFRQPTDTELARSRSAYPPTLHCSRRNAQMLSTPVLINEGLQSLSAGRLWIYSAGW